MAQSLSQLYTHIVFSTKKDTVVRYIANQKEHHKTLSFKEEVLKFLQEYDIEYDERYLWD